METKRKLLVRIASVVLLGAVIAGCASGPKEPSSELLQRIESARSPSDHEALGGYYEQEAKLARAKAVEHRKMGKSYQAGAVSAKGGMSSMPAHCNSVANQYEGVATEYDALAAEHRAMASRAQPKD